MNVRAKNLTPQENISVCLAGRRPLTPNIAEFELREVSGRRLPPFRPGAHIKIDVKLSSGRRGMRAYSVVNGPGSPDRYIIAVQREEAGSGGSRFLHTLDRGVTLQISPPICDFELNSLAQHHVLVAGGIGITPILSMARHLVMSRKSFETHYVGRRLDLMAYAKEVQEIAGSSIVCDEGRPELGLRWDALFSKICPDTHVYVCGPRSLIEATLKEGRNRGLAETQLHYEAFQTQNALEDRTCRVHLKRTGSSLNVPPGISILDALIEAGIDVLHDCRRANVAFALQTSLTAVQIIGILH